MSNETTGKKITNNLKCHRDNDKATSVCGSCGKPICRDHTEKLRDSTYNTFENSNRRLYYFIGGVFALPLILVYFVPGTVVSDIEAEIFGNQIFIESMALRSSIIIGLAGLYTTWYQGADRKSSIRILYRNPPTRHLCVNCYDDKSLQRFLYLGILGIVSLLVLLGLYRAVQSSTVLPLQISSVGFAVYIIRDDLIMFIMRLLEGS